MADRCVQSLVAQQYFEPQLSEIILDQACILAKRVYSQDSTVSEGVESSSDEEERCKVWTSLFLREKCVSLFRGRNCSLPAFDWSPLSSKMYDWSDTSLPARLELARLQELAYLVLYSNEATRQSSAQRSTYIFVLNDRLEKWAQASSSILSERISATTDLHLAFRSTRVMALRTSPDPAHKEQVLQDSRVICRLLAVPKRSTGSSPNVMPLQR